MRNSVHTEVVRGRIWEALLSDGTTNPDLADRLWDANTAPSSRRGKEAARSAASMRAAKAKPQAASPGDRNSEDEDGDDDAGPASTPAPALRRQVSFKEDPPWRRPSVNVTTRWSSLRATG